MSRREAERAHRVNLETWRALARATGRELIERDGLLTYFSLARAPNFNPTVVVDSLGDSFAALDDREAEYVARSIPFGFEVPEGLDERTEKAALERGMRRSHTQPVMVIRPRIFESSQLDVREVGSEGVATHNAVAAEGFGDDPDDLRTFMPQSVTGACRLFVGYLDGEPAATSVCVVTDEGAGIFSVATIERHRRRGFGRAMTEAAISAAAREGADFAFLHASTDGFPVYERMGFRTVGEVNVYRSA